MYLIFSSWRFRLCCSQPLVQIGSEWKQLLALIAACISPCLLLMTESDEFPLFVTSGLLTLNSPQRWQNCRHWQEICMITRQNILNMLFSCFQVLISTSRHLLYQVQCSWYVFLLVYNFKSLGADSDQVVRGDFFLMVHAQISSRTETLFFPSFSLCVAFGTL